MEKIRILPRLAKMCRIKQTGELNDDESDKFYCISWYQIMHGFIVSLEIQGNRYAKVSLNLKKSELVF